MESNTPRFDEYLRRNPHHATSAIARFELDGDIAALEARHAKEIRQRDNRIGELSVESENRLAWVHRNQEEIDQLRETIDQQAEAISQARRAAYEDAAKMVVALTVDGNLNGPLRYLHSEMVKKAGGL